MRVKCQWGAGGGGVARTTEPLSARLVTGQNALRCPQAASLRGSGPDICGRSPPLRWISLSLSLPLSTCTQAIRGVREMDTFLELVAINNKKKKEKKRERERKVFRPSGPFQ